MCGISFIIHTYIYVYIIKLIHSSQKVRRKSGRLREKKPLRVMNRF